MSIVRRKDGRRPAILLLPPLGADHRFFEPVAEHLDHDIWTASAVPAGKERSVGDVADRVGREMTNAGLARAVVVGVSLGGLIGQHLAAARPELVSHLVLADTVVTYPAELRRMWHDRADQVEAAGVGSVLAATLDTWYGATEVRSKDLEDRCAAMVLAADPDGYAASCRALRDADASAILPSIAAPTLVLCGRYDAPPFRAGAEQLADQLSGATPVAWIDDAHHAALLERPEQSAALIAAYLSEER